MRAAARRRRGPRVVPRDRRVVAADEASGELGAHFDAAYRDRGEQVSWHEPTPDSSLALIERLGVAPTATVLDVGGGGSGLAAALAARGFADVTVLDVSAVGLAAARRRAGGRDDLTLVLGDVRTFRPGRRFDLWHDRAVLHFLTDERDRAAYVATLRAVLEPHGAVVIGTFADDGPATCSGLPVRRAEAAALVSLLGDGFGVVDVRRAVHVTPAGVAQPFTWVALRADARPTD